MSLNLPAAYDEEDFWAQRPISQSLLDQKSNERLDYDVMMALEGDLSPLSEGEDVDMVDDEDDVPSKAAEIRSEDNDVEMENEEIMVIDKPIDMPMKTQ
jgi:hypothetical protein